MLTTQRPPQEENWNNLSQNLLLHSLLSVQQWITKFNKFLTVIWMRLTINFPVNPETCTFKRITKASDHRSKSLISSLNPLLDHRIFCNCQKAGRARKIKSLTQRTKSWALQKQAHASTWLNCICCNYLQKSLSTRCVTSKKDLNTWISH